MPPTVTRCRCASGSTRPRSTPSRTATRSSPRSTSRAGAAWSGASGWSRTTWASPSRSMSARAPLYNLAAARGEEQLERMRRLEAEGVCVFCLEHAAAFQREPVEEVGTHWYVTRNDFPYEGAEDHYLIVARRHVVSFDELPEEAGAE